MSNTPPGATFGVFFRNTQNDAFAVLVNTQAQALRLRRFLRAMPHARNVTLMILQHSAPIPDDPTFISFSVLDQRTLPTTDEPLWEALQE